MSDLACYRQLRIAATNTSIHGADSHSDAEDDAGKDALGLALAVGEHQTADDDRDQRQPGRDRAGEGSFQDVDRVVPRVAAGRLRVQRQRRQQKRWDGETFEGAAARPPKEWAPLGWSSALHRSSPLVVAVEWPLSGRMCWM